MNKLCRVQGAKQGIHVGSLLARRGAWQNKHEVMQILHNFATGEIHVQIRFFGRYYADGREIPSKRRPLSWKYGMVHPDTLCIILPGHEHVVPRLSKIKRKRYYRPRTGPVRNI